MEIRNKVAKFSIGMVIIFTLLNLVDFFKKTLFLIKNIDIMSGQPLFNFMIIFYIIMFSLIVGFGIIALYLKCKQH